jgi:GT2 family glycosyltransferase
MYDEDVELSIRLQNMKYKILYLPQALVYHKCQGSQVKTTNVPSNQLDPKHPSLLFYLTNTIINRRYTLSKHLKQKQLKTYFIFNIYWLAKSAQYLLHGKFRAFATTLSCLIKSYDKHPHIKH